MSRDPVKISDCASDNFQGFGDFLHLHNVILRRTMRFAAHGVVFVIFLAVILCSLANEAFAADPTCTAAASDMNFGATNLSSGLAFYTTTQVTISCAGGDANRPITFCVSVGEGSIVTGNGSPRVMSNGTSLLLFDLYADPTRLQVFGSFYWPQSLSLPGRQYNSTLNAAGSVVMNVQVYGAILAAQTGVTVGTYTATFTTADIKVRYGYSDQGNCLSNSWTTAPASTPMTARASYSESCSLAATNLVFPASQLLTSAKDGASSVTATCSSGTPYTIGLGLGLGAGVTSATARKMTSGAGGEIVYGLYLDTGRSQPWGPSSPELYSATGNGAAQAITVYGRVPAQTSPAPGTYSDTIIATVTY